MITVNDCDSVLANLVPVHINHSGEANVAKYFKPEPTADSHVEVYFRGVKLVGTEVPLDFQGVILEKALESIETSDNGTSHTVNNYQLVGSFSSYTVFGHDQAPGLSQYTRVNEWKAIADIIHE